MIIISSDINKQTYAPGTRVFSLNLLFYKKKHPKTLGYVYVHDRTNSIIFFSYQMCHMFLTLVFSPPLLIFILLKYTTV